MNKLMIVLMLALAVGIASPRVHAENDTTVGVDAEVGVGDLDTTVEATATAETQHETETETEVESETEVDDDSTDTENDSDDTDEESADDDNGADDADEESADDDDGTADQGSGDVDAETQHEVEAMDLTVGAQLRFEQLHHQIERRIIFGQAVVDRLQNANVSANVTAKLNAILEDLSGLSAEAEAAADANLTKDEAIEKFLAIKEEAKDKVAEFRAIVKDQLSAADKEALRKRFDELDREKLKELRDRVLERLHEFNSERVKGLLAAIGESDSDLAERIRNGELTADEIKLRIREKVDERTDAQKREIALRLKEAETKRKVARADAVREARDKVVEQRMELRTKIAENRVEIREKLRERTTDAAGNRIEQRTETRVRSDGTVETRDRLKIREPARSGSDDTKTDDGSSGSGSSDDDGTPDQGSGDN